MLKPMDADERDICIYLRGFREHFISFAEISRRAGGKKRVRQDPTWATPVLNRLVERGIVESDTTGHYRLKPTPPKTRTTKWVSPQMRRILEASGKTFEIPDEDVEEFLKDIDR